MAPRNFLLQDFSVATFRQKIERYAEGGGDGGLTRATMRAACGLPAEDVALHPDGAGHGVAPRPGPRVVETGGGEAGVVIVGSRPFNLLPCAGGKRSNTPRFTEMRGINPGPASRR